MIKVKFDNRTIELEQPTKINVLLQKEIEETEAIACMYNNEVKPLNKTIEEDCEMSNGTVLFDTSSISKVMMML